MSICRGFKLAITTCLFSLSLSSCVFGPYNSNTFTVQKQSFNEYIGTGKGAAMIEVKIPSSQWRYNDFYLSRQQDPTSTYLSFGPGRHDGSIYRVMAGAKTDNSSLERRHSSVMDYIMSFYVKQNGDGRWPKEVLKRHMRVKGKPAIYSVYTLPYHVGSQKGLYTFMSYTVDYDRHVVILSMVADSNSTDNHVSLEAAKVGSNASLREFVAGFRLDEHKPA